MKLQNISTRLIILVFGAEVYRFAPDEILDVKLEKKKLLANPVAKHFIDTKQLVAPVVVEDGQNDKGKSGNDKENGGSQGETADKELLALREEAKLFDIKSPHLYKKEALIAKIAEAKNA